MPRQTAEVYQLRNTQDPSAAFTELNRLLQRINTRLDQLEGQNGTPTFYSDLNLRGTSTVKNLADPVDPRDAQIKALALALNRATNAYDALGNPISNLGTATTATQAVTLQQLRSAIDASSVLNEPFVVAVASAKLLADRVLSGEATVITITDNGANSTIVVSITANGVTDAKLRQGTALTVIGRSANSSGNVADIAAAAASDAVLRESGSTLGFGTVATGGLANNAVTDAKLRQGAATSVVGRSANSLGNVADIAAAADTDVLRRSAGALGFGQLTTAYLSDYSTSTFTATGTGFTASVTGTAKYVKLGSMVILFLPTLTGTSNATSFTITGLPAGITPATNFYRPTLIADNGTVALGYVYFNAGTLELAPGNMSVSGWTAAGTKTFYATHIAYYLV